MEEIEIVWKAILAFLKKDNPTMFSIILRGCNLNCVKACS